MTSGITISGPIATEMKQGRKRHWHEIKKKREPYFEHFKSQLSNVVLADAAYDVNIPDQDNHIPATVTVQCLQYLAADTKGSCLSVSHFNEREMPDARVLIFGCTLNNPQRSKSVEPQAQHAW